MTESQERLVRAILERQPALRIVEMHVFPPLRQGGLETAVAVVAARRDGSHAAEPDPDERHTIFTARYRLTRRGPERGKWEFDIVEEADAPLVALDAVVRGVQDRAGDAGDPERLGAAALAGYAPQAAARAQNASPPWTTARP